MKIGLSCGGIQYAGGTPVAPTMPSASLAMRLVADAGVTLDSGVVATWSDQTANGLHVTGAGTARPAVTSNWQNGRDGIAFDGSNDVLSRSTSFFTAGTPLTVAMVVAATSDPDSVDPGSNERAYFGIQSTSGADFRANTRFDAAPFRQVAWTGSAGVTISGTYGMGTVPNVVIWATDGSSGSANFVFRVNGAAKTTSGALTNTSSSSLSITVGAGSLSHACTIGELLIYTAFSTDLFADIEEYLAYAWDL